MEDFVLFNRSILTGKTHHSLEDPLSQLYYDVSDLISPHVYSMGITPNAVTMIRAILAIPLIVYLFDKKMYRVAAIIYMLAYYMDTLDGHMARKYNMQTIEGDYFDHVTDVISVALSIYLISCSLGKKYEWLTYLIIVMLVLSMVQVSCQERYLNNTKLEISSGSLSPLCILCPQSLISDDNLEDTLEWMRMMGVGTYHLFVMVIIWNLGDLKVD